MHRPSTSISFQTIRLFVIAVLLGSLAISLFGATGTRPAHAVTTWVVTSLADTTGTLCPNASNCTLRQAMIQAASGDTITFGLSGTITLGSTLPSVSNTLTIDGMGQSVVISGNNAVRIMFVNSGSNLSLNALTLSNGNVGSSGTGGAIYNVGMLNIASSTFAANTSASGGAIENGGTVNIANSTFSGNTAVQGGAIHNGSTVNIANSTFSGNTAMPGGAPLGGAIFNGWTLNIANSTFAGNSAPAAGDGGAIYNFNNTVKLNNSILTNDSVGDCAGSGSFSSANDLSDGSCGVAAKAVTNIAATPASNGGPTQTFALLSLSNAINTVPSGACLYVSTGTNPLFTNGATITIDQRGVSRPQGPRCDIGAYEFPAPTITLSPSSLPNGTIGTAYSQTISASGGTGSYTFTVTSGALPPGLSLSIGGALTGSPTKIGLYNFTVTATDANQFTASQSYSPSIFAAANSALVVNTLADPGTGDCASSCSLRTAMIYAGTGDSITFSVSGTITLGSTLPAVQNMLTIDGTGQSVAISGNNAVQVLSVGSNGNLTLKSLTIAHGFTSGNGGGLENAGGTVAILSSTFTGNSTNASSCCGGFGAGLENTGGGTVTIQNSVFTGNTTNSTLSGVGFGAGLYNDAKMTISNSTFANNTINESYAGGAGLYDDGNLTISNSTFANNTAPGNFSFGGGVAVGAPGIVTISNSAFSGNSANYGGGLVNTAVGSGGEVVVSNSTFSANVASGGYGGGLYNFNSGTLNLGSSIIAANTGSSGPDVYNYNSFSGGGTLNSLGYNLVGDGTGSGLTNGMNGDQIGTSASPINPQLGALANNGGLTQTMALQFGSPALRKGNCGWTGSYPTPPPPAVATDQRGVPRRSPCDAGSFEFVPHVDTIGIFRSGTFYLRLHNSTGNADISVAFSQGTKPYPVVGDWTGAGFDTVGVYDQSNGLFTLCTANTTTSCANAANRIQFVLGIPNDQPIAGRWNASFSHFGGGVFRPSNGLIYLRNNLTSGFADYTMVLGIPGDVGLAGDWNGDGLDSLGVYRPTNSTFYLNDQTCNCSLFGTYQFAYGLGGDAPVVGDWIGQGHDGVGLFRQTNGFTYLRNTLTTGYADIAFVYGVAGDVPVAGHWQLIYPPVPGGVLVPPTTAPVPTGSAPGDGVGD